MKNESPTEVQRIPTDIVAAARKESERMGGSTTLGDLLRHWLRLGMKADPQPKALLP